MIQKRNELRFLVIQMFFWYELSLVQVLHASQPVNADVKALSQ